MSRAPDPTTTVDDAGMLLVLAPGVDGQPTGDLYLTIGGTGDVTAYNGHVDLGTGIRTALAQIVAEELDVPFAAVRMVLGSTARVPDQGATIASETIQITAVPLRHAAATARAYLLAEAALRLNAGLLDLRIANGIIEAGAEDDRRLAIADLVAGRSVRLAVDRGAPLKDPATYRIVGRSQPRVDIPAKATGAWTYVHDVRVPGMLHGRVVRPPYAGFDSGPHVGHSLIGVDRASVAGVPGLVAVVAIGDFVGVVAAREEQAEEAAARLRVEWRTPPSQPDLNAPEKALRDTPSRPRRLLDRGDVDRALAGAAQPMDRTYLWPYQMHGSIGPSCAVADVRDDGVTVWSGTQSPFPLRAELAVLLQRPEGEIAIERMEAAGCYGRNCADDVSADAVLLSRAVQRPVRVQLTRAQEHAWEPKGAAQVIDVRGGLDSEGGPAAYDFETRYPSNGAPTLALILTGRIPATPAVLQMGDRTAVPPYAFGHARVTVHDMPPIARASWFRGVSAMPNTFAHESFIDELAVAAGIDPIDYRLRYLPDTRAADLLRAVAEKARWVPHAGPFTHGGSGDILYGRGVAYAVYVHGPFPGKAAAWAAWVADVAVNKVTGEVAVTRVVAGQDAGLMINPDGVRHQIHGNVIQSTSRVLMESVGFSATAVESREWGGYPILTFPNLPVIDVLMMDRPTEPPLGAGESASVPSAAAIANALFDATGVRFRELPLTPERVRAALNPLPPPPAPPPPVRTRSGWRRWLSPVLGLVVGGLALGTLASPWRPSIEPIARPAADVFSAATIERGRLASAAGACNVCHVGSDGVALAGGRALETPFGVVHATNITPDVATGIGAWSYPAFERAMRGGVSRDGHHLYPVHPYPSFAGADEGDLEALYAYLMAQPAVARVAPATTLGFPFNLRVLMAGWNALFLRAAPAPDAADPARGEAWNRGAYLVETLGHCGACHTERNALGAEKTGAAHLAGGYADGWHAPALDGRSTAPVGWTMSALYDYLRDGHAADHGPAGGPMADVVAALKPLPDADIRAMATYLAGLNGTAPSQDEAARAAAATLQASDAAIETARLAFPKGARLFQGACGACHGPDAPLTSLALDGNLHAARPDNVVQSILHGVASPTSLRGAAAADVAAMPAFAASLGDGDIAELVRYARARFAPGRPAWERIEATIATARGR
jgi:nicotinate dehydrogenase subunit B